MYNKLKFLHRKTHPVFFFKFLMIRLLSRHHPAANPSPPFPLCPAAGQRGRGGEGLAEAQLPHIFQDGVSSFAPAQCGPDRRGRPNALASSGAHRIFIWCRHSFVVGQWRTQGRGTRARAPPLAISWVRCRRKNKIKIKTIKNLNGKFGQLQTFLTCNSIA